MEENKQKIQSGIVYFSLFVFVVVLISMSGRKLSFVGVEKSVRSFLSSVTGNRSLSSTTLLKQSLVEEESAVIDVVDRVSPAVVSVFVNSSDFDPFSLSSGEPEGIGTGFIVDKKGLVITNSHVVDQEGVQYSIVLKDGTSFDVTKIHIDPIDDLAILEVKSDKDFPTVELGDSSTLKVGQKAVAIGNALGEFSNTVTVGVVSGLQRSVTASGPGGVSPKRYPDVIQTDAAINPGNSGGPLLNLSGQVIGVNVATSSGADNISFAIPANRLKPIIESFQSTGRIIRPYMGVAFRIIRPDVSKIRELPEGAYITDVGEGTPAEEAGLLKGDIIVKVDDQVINQKNSLELVIQQKYKVGDIVALEVYRDKKTQTLDLKLGEAPPASN